MLKSVQDFTKNFFYEKPDKDDIRSVRYEPFKSRKTRNMAPKYHTIRSTARKNRVNRYTRPTSSSRNWNNKTNNKPWHFPRPPTSGIWDSCVKKLPSIKDYIHSVFSNDTETITHLQRSCEDITLQIRNSSRGRYNEHALLRQRIEQSKAFKTKVNELKYDKEQLEKLRRSRKMAPNGCLGDELSPKTIEDDRIFLLKNENRLLKRDLESTKNELDITKKRLEFTLDKNTKYAKEISDLKIQLNDYKLMKLAAKTAPYVERESDIFTQQPNLRSDKLNSEFPFEKGTTEPLHHVSRPARDNFDNLSPISVDYSRYSDSPDIIR